jgi:hypothetical protein
MQIRIVKLSQTRRERWSQVILVAINEGTYERHPLSLSYGR